MKRLASLFATGSLAACMDAGTSPATSQALPADSHYVVVPRGYASPEACIANEPQPFSCLYSLSLCRNGRAGARTGDIVEAGTYDLDGSVAYVTFEHGSAMEFDVQAVVDLGDPSTTWIVDTKRRWETLQFDNIDCSRP